MFYSSGSACLRVQIETNGNLRKNMFRTWKQIILGHITLLKLVHIFYNYTTENKLLVADIFISFNCYIKMRHHAGKL